MRTLFVILTLFYSNVAHAESQQQMVKDFCKDQEKIQILTKKLKTVPNRGIVYDAKNKKTLIHPLAKEMQKISTEQSSISNKHFAIYNQSIDPNRCSH